MVTSTVRSVATQTFHIRYYSTLHHDSKVPLCDLLVTGSRYSAMELMEDEFVGFGFVVVKGLAPTPSST